MTFFSHLVTQNQIINQVNMFFIAGTSWSAATCESVHCAAVFTVQQPVNATFLPTVCLKIIYSLTPALYMP